MNDRSPFLDIPPDQWVVHNELAFAFRDRFPVSPGHTLVVPRRVISDWWGATAEERLAIPEGPTDIRVGSRIYQADFVKIALNVVREKGSSANALPDILWNWFGPDAGQPGTAFEVEFAFESGTWHMAPVRAAMVEESG